MGTNQRTQGKKDPLPYDVKIKAMEAIWPEVAGHIVPETSLFTLAAKVYEQLGEVDVVVYTDEDWLTKTLEKYNGEQGKYGYYKFNSIQQKPTPRLSSATDVRNAVLADDRDAFERAAGVPANHKIDGKDYFDLVSEYLTPLHAKEGKSDKYKQHPNLEESIMDINTLRQLAGLPVKEAAPVNFAPGYAMNDAQKKLSGVGQLLMQQAEDEREPKMSNALAALGGALADGSISTTDDLVSFIKSYKVQGDKERDQPTPLTDQQKSELSDATSKAIAAYNSGERAAGLKPGEKAEDDMNNDPDEFAVPDDAEVPELEQESIDLSDIRSDYDVEEGVNDSQALMQMLGQFEKECADMDCYGDVDAKAVQYYLNRGNIQGAAEEMTAAMSDRNGGEASDDAFELAKEMVADYLGAHGDMGQEMARYESTEKAVAETTQNAMDSALAELRKLAGL